jgi:NAD(P)H-hydrate epimerase
MPLPVITVAGMREWEKAAWAAGRSETEVIRRVGQAIAREALRLTRPGALILILAGKGHNGDDARCAREHLADRRVDLLETRDPELDYPKLEALLSLRPALAIDGLFGIGLNRPLSEAWIRFLHRLNEARLRVLAVDVPSGLNADTGQPEGAAVEAAATLTVGAPKRGLLAQAASRYVGRLEIATETGLVPCSEQSDLFWTLAEDFEGFPLTRPVEAHKGSQGHVGILAGSMGYHGAAVLAARGAQRARPGLVSVFTHEPAYAPVASQLQAVMVHPWSPDLQLARGLSALLIGPGLASAAVPEEMKAMARRLWSELPAPVVADASALDWLPPGPTSKESIRVLTPHPGEAARLLKTAAAQVQSNRPEALREISARFGNCWVILKGHQTLVGRATDGLYVNSSGNPNLAQGGAGDLLGGYAAGFLAQPAGASDPLRAIRYAVWQHGAAADALEQLKPNWIIEDLAEMLGSVRGQ